MKCECECYVLQEGNLGLSWARFDSIKKNSNSTEEARLEVLTLQQSKLGWVGQWHNSKRFTGSP